MLTDTIRKMASIQQISSLEPIENSDFLEVAMMENLGWKVVVKKGESKVGDTVIYIEIDSAINVKDLIEPLLEKMYEIGFKEVLKEFHVLNLETAEESHAMVSGE